MNHADQMVPTRVLEIDTAAFKPKVRLVLTEKMQISKLRYATLSHCWGGQTPVRLLNANAENFQSAIPWNALPTTFRDAILVISQLGIEYLWIDALCIIQDSKEDWADEAARMTTVYANSALNISADASFNSTQGLFRKRSESFVYPFCVSLRPHDKGDKYLFYVDEWDNAIDRSPLNRRAWVVQEVSASNGKSHVIVLQKPAGSDHLLQRYLAPRVVHFAQDQVYWECQCLMTAETLPDNFDSEISARPGFTKKMASLLTASDSGWRTEVYRLWDGLAAQYANSDLTFTSDRPIAISGMSRAFSYLFGVRPSDYLCGLWRPVFIQELLWSCFDQAEIRTSCSSATEITASHVPSWSWISAHRDRFVALSSSASYTDHTVTEIAKVVELSTSPVDDPFGPISSSHVKLRSPLCNANFSRTSNPFNPKVCGLRKNATITIANKTFRENESFLLMLDGPSVHAIEQTPDQNVYLMLVTMTPYGFDPRREKAEDDTDSQNSAALLSKAELTSCVKRRFLYIAWET